MIFKKTRWEINRHFVLRLFIAIISLLMVIQWYEWTTLFGDVISDIEYGRVVPWPLGSAWESFVSNFIYANFNLVRFSGIALAVLAILLTFNTHTYIAAFFVSMFAFILLQVFFFCDYRLGSHVHHVLSLLGLVFFFLPNKRKSIKTLVLLIFVISGLYQLNTDYLTARAHNINWILNLQIPFVVVMLFLRITSPFYFLAKIKS
ncbi:MAG: hypothetical protein R2827_05375 [Bdellovibrionales bacterium]